jgi:hypothetical protein
MSLFQSLGDLKRAYAEKCKQEALSEVEKQLQAEETKAKREAADAAALAKADEAVKEKISEVGRVEEQLLAPQEPRRTDWEEVI